MSKHVKHVPKHRAAPVRPALPAMDAPRRAVRTTVVLSSVAAAATGATVAGGVLTGPGAAVSAAASGGTDVVAERVAASIAPSAAGDGTSGSAASDQTGTASPAELGEREPVVSRSDRRAVADPAKEQALAADEAPAMTASETLADDDPRDIARALLPQFGFSADQFSCLDSLWTKESGWDPSADNPTSSAYGIPQSLPGSKMASAGADWATNPATQIEWGLGYIQDVYGSPCSAWGHSQAMNWY